MELEKLVGKDVRQAEKYAEGIDNTISKAQAELVALENRQKELLIELADLNKKSAAAHNYVTHLKKL